MSGSWYCMGGIGPAPRRRALAALRFGEREEISRGIAVGRSIRQIAQGLGRAPSTVSREIRRNGGSQAIEQTGLIGVPGSGHCVPSPVVWRCTASYDGAWHRNSRCNGRQKQISGWLKQEFPTDQDMQISHEAIYRSLFIQTRGVLKKELTAHLRTARRMRRPKSHNAKEWTGAYPRYGLHPRAARRD